LMGRAVRYILAVVGGAIAGYVALTIAANLEDWQFYSLRSLVTGRSAMSEIVDHPADRWVIPLLLAVFVGGGAVAGVLLVEWSRLRTRSKAEPAVAPDRGGITVS